MKSNQVFCVCGGCGKTFSVKASRHAKGRGIYCSRACQAVGWTRDAPKRFYARLINRENGCIEYIKDKNEKWYPSVKTEQRKNESAHRYAWVLSGRSIPKGLFILHICDNPRCCNVEHLFLGTQQDNMADKVSKGRQAIREKNGMGKLTAEQALQAINLRNDGHTYKSIGNIFGVTGEAIFYIYKKGVASI